MMYSVHVNVYNAHYKFTTQISSCSSFGPCLHVGLLCVIQHRCEVLSYIIRPLPKTHFICVFCISIHITVCVVQLDLFAICKGGHFQDGFQGINSLYTVKDFPCEMYIWCNIISKCYPKCIVPTQKSPVAAQY